MFHYMVVLQLTVVLKDYNDKLAGANYVHFL